MRVFLFGAGASHSYSLSSTGVKPPLAKGFFEAYNRLLISQDRYVLVGDIINYVRDTRKINPIEFGRWNENIEFFMTEIDEQLSKKEEALKLPCKKRIQFSRAYDQMIFLFTSILNEIQNGPPCSNYTSLANKLNKEDVLITFNWDCLLDRVLWERGDWTPYDGYGLQFHGFYDSGWKNEKTSVASTNKLLKLHGSTNWMMPYFTFNISTGVRNFVNLGVEPDKRPMFCFVKADSIYKTYRNRSKAGYAPFSYYYYPPDIPVSTKQRKNGKLRVSIVNAIDLPDHGQITIGGNPYSSMPLIVAPLKHKDYGILGNTLDSLWVQASEAIAKCDELIIIGYSFPATDDRAWLLLDEASAKRNHALAITLVDPYPERISENIKNRLRERCNLNVNRISFSEYIDKQN